MPKSKRCLAQLKGAVQGDVKAANYVLARNLLGGWRACSHGAVHRRCALPCATQSVARLVQLLCVGRELHCSSAT